MWLDMNCTRLPDIPCPPVFRWEKTGIILLGLLNQTLEVKLLFRGFCFSCVRWQNISESSNNLQPYNRNSHVCSG